MSFPYGFQMETLSLFDAMAVLRLFCTGSAVPLFCWPWCLRALRRLPLPISVRTQLQPSTRPPRYPFPSMNPNLSASDYDNHTLSACLQLAPPALGADESVRTDHYLARKGVERSLLRWF